MDVKGDIRDFLTSRRARIKPEDAPLPIQRGRRRVVGLRREEVAMLAGISVEYYTRLERGNAEGVSSDVLEAVARALRLDEAERAHLFNLIRTANLARTSLPRRRPPQERVRPVVQQILDLIGAPAYLRNGRLDILAANSFGRALYSPLFEDLGPTVPNMARFIFFNSTAAQLFPDWEEVANDAVAILRAQAGRDPFDRRLSDLIGELSMRSDQFRVRWAAQDVKFHRTGTKRLHHPVVGLMTLSFEALELASDDGQRINVYMAEPGSPSDDALKLLGSWSTAPLHPDLRSGGQAQ
ncbi:MAG: helix-turn-helix transcriptional regulator [Nitrospiraceae bacterium]|nr:helix-turn-helix transcriptional regulator [Nitrospiraceae bacterium]MDA8209354.1 helix-turn-helix transcriptional regulator [Actinomycetota bacterium]